MSLPTISHYHNGKPNAVCVSIGGLDLYFSYTTIVAFRDNGRLVLSENVWSTTTGKHLNEIGSKEKQIPHSEFEEQLEQIVERFK